MTDERMREALEESAWAIQELLALIHGECPGILDSDRGGSWAQVERIDKALASAMEALSPPARRTSYEWEHDGLRYSVRWSECWCSYVWNAHAKQWRWVGSGPAAAAAAIATLAGLEKEES